MIRAIIAMRVCNKKINKKPAREIVKEFINPV